MRSPSTPARTHTRLHPHRNQERVHIGMRRYVIEHVARAYGSDRGIDTAAVMRALSSDIRVIEGVRYVDEIALHCHIRALEQARSQEKAAVTDTQDAEPSKRSILHPALFFLAAVGFGGMAMIGIVTYMIDSKHMENTFSHSARIAEEPTAYSTLSANPSFVFIDLIRAVGERMRIGRE